MKRFGCKLRRTATAREPSEKSEAATGVTAGVLRLLKYGSRAQLEALAELAGKEEGFDDLECVKRAN